MIHYLQYNDIDKRKWNRSIEKAGNGLIYALSWYLDIVSPGWAALVEGDYEKVFPLPVKKKFGINYVIQPPFVQQLGLFSEHPVAEKEVSSFCQTIAAKYKYMDIQLNEKNPLREIAIKKIPRRTIILNLFNVTSSPEENYHDNTRRNLRKYYKTDLAVIEDPLSTEDMIHLFSEGQGKKYRIKKTQYEKLSRLLSWLRGEQLSEVLVIRQNDILLSGAVFIKSFDRYIFLFSASNRQGRSLHALTGIMDYFIRNHAGEKMLLDFEGSDDDNLARFYKGFGGEEIFYYRVISNRLPQIIRWIKTR